MVVVVPRVSRVALGSVLVLVASGTMEMTPQAYRLEQQQPAVYGKKSVPSLVMVGRWGVSFSIAPPGQRPFDVLLLDHAQG